MQCLQNTRHFLIPAFLSQRTIFYSIISPQVTLADWNPNDSEADDCYPVWSLSRLLSRAKKSLIQALIFRQDWFYSDINDVRGSFNHRHLSNIQQKNHPVLLLTQSLSATLCKVSRPGIVFKWLHAQIQQLTSWQWNIRESA